MKTDGIICKDKNIEKYALDNYGRLSGMTTMGIIITALSEYASQRDTEPKEEPNLSHCPECGYATSNGHIRGCQFYPKGEDIGNAIFHVLNEYAYNDENSAGNKISIIDAGDIPIIIPKILGAISQLKEPKEEVKGAEEINRLINWLKARYPIDDITVDAVRFIMKEYASLPKEQSVTDEPSDTHKCKECGGRTALIHGSFYYEPDSEPYMSGVEEEAKVSTGECWVGGYKCDDCGNIQGLWHE